MKNNQKLRPSPKLVPKPEFEQALKKILSVTKAESDEQMARFQASNKAKRKVPKPKG